MMTPQETESLLMELAPVGTQVRSLDRRIRDMEAKVAGTRNRVRFFEGCFKTFGTMPAAADFEDGSMLLYESGTDRQVCALISGTWRCWKANGAVYYDDVNVGGVSLGQGASAPDMVTLTGNILMPGFDGNATTEMLYGCIELPHSYIEGTDIVPHIHWCPSTTGSGNVRWTLEYSWANPGNDTAFPASTAETITSAASGTDNWNTFANFSTVSGTGKKISSHFAFRLSRNPTDGADTYGDDALLVAFGLHFQTDGYGSVQITTKN